MPLVHLASRLYGTPLLIARPKLEVILSVLGSRIGWPEIQTALPIPQQKRALAETQAGIAIIPVYGTLVRRSMGVEAASGLMSYAEIDARLQAAMADPSVSGILLELDSPGGEAGGVFDLAQRIRAASQIKPIWAHANDGAYSAAYALAAAADRLTLSQTAGVGSIGVIALHVDQSVKDAKDGLTYTAVHAGAHKNDFSPHQPLTPQAATALQTEVDRLYEIFSTQVAEMRGLSVEAVRATQAGVFFGDAAVGAGLADAVAPMEQVLLEFADALAAQRRMASPQRGALARASPDSPIPSIPNHPTQEPTVNEHDNIEETKEEPKDEPSAIPVKEPNEVSGRTQAQAIAELCLIAGHANRTAEFLASGMSESQVRRALLNARAEQPEIASRINPDAVVAHPTAASPVVAAVKKLNAKE